MAMVAVCFPLASGFTSVICPIVIPVLSFTDRPAAICPVALAPPAAGAGRQFCCGSRRRGRRRRLGARRRRGRRGPGAAAWLGWPGGFAGGVGCSRACADREREGQDCRPADNRRAHLCLPSLWSPREFNAGFRSPLPSRVLCRVPEIIQQLQTRGPRRLFETTPSGRIDPAGAPGFVLPLPRSFAEAWPGLCASLRSLRRSGG